MKRIKEIIGSAKKLVLDIAGVFEEFFKESEKFFNKYLVIMDALIKSVMALAASSVKERNRIWILSLSVLFCLDYAMYSYLTDKNIFDIFPSFPKLDDRQEMDIYIPSVDCKTVVKEKREVPVFDSEEKQAAYLFRLVARGSVFENTSMMVPVDLFVKRVWIYRSGAAGKACILDIEAGPIPENVPVYANSEVLFRKAIEKTIKTNIPSIKSVYLLDKGVPDRNLWDI
ncbi:MAG: hypothetical protein MUD12_02040 [Spirochaetes bacterium]|jgi:hypothetical protein|nr:hypothetical protein [Spirochaetota bacterium]